MSDSIKPLVTLTNISKAYSKSVLSECSFECVAGEFIAIIGESGSGKSTLLNIISLLERPDSGSVRILGKELNTDKEIATFRREKMGFIYQNYNLLENLTVLENILLLENFSHTDYDPVYFDNLLEKLGLNTLTNQVCSTLSGGEKQRVAVARALLYKPMLIVADEPTGNLDDENADRILTMLLDLNASYNVSILLVTHDMRKTKDVTKILELKNGRLNTYEKI